MMESNNCAMLVSLVEPNSCPLGVQLVNCQRTNKTSDSSDLVELARAVQKADEFTKANAGSKLKVIADQIRHLQNQARKVLEEAKRNASLHHAACNLVKRPGTMYYLYERESGQSYLSILSPQVPVKLNSNAEDFSLSEWGSACPHNFLGAYRLEYDQSWTPITEIENRDQENALIDKIFTTQQAITSSSSTAEILGFKQISNKTLISDVTGEEDS